jgi:serine/threonine protein kinase
MARLVRVGDPVGAGERRAAAALEEGLPAEWTVIANKLLVSPGQTPREIDFIVIGDNAVFLVDEKSWVGRIEGDDSWWTVDRSFTTRSPINNMEMLSKRISGFLKDRIAGLREAVTRPFVFPIVLLSAREIDLNIDDPRAAAQVLRLDECADELMRLDRAHPTRASIHSFAQAIAAALIGLRDRPSVPQFINDYEVLESLGGREGSRTFRVRHRDGTARILRLIEKPDSEIEAKRAATEDLLLREYTALRKAGEHGIAPRVDPYFSWADDSCWVIPIHVTTAKSLRTLAIGTAGGVAIVPARVVAGAFESLAALHDLGIIHRSINPESVLLGDDDTVLFDDFDLSHIEGERSLLPSLGEFEVEDAYAAPELAIGLGGAERASDVYSLAATLLSWLSGLEPTRDQPWTARTAPLEEADEHLGDAATVDTLATCLGGDPAARPTAAGVRELVAKAVSPPAALATNQLVPGAIVDGQYEIIRLLGWGASGVSALARDRLTGEDCVLKAINNPELQLSLAGAEFRALRSLSHPGLPRVLDIRPPGEVFQLKLEYIEGESLRVLEQQQPKDFDVALGVAKDLGEVLAYLETAGYLHRDITPANILVPSDATQSIKLIDFGLATPVSGQTLLVGTPLFRAPEIDAGRPWSAKADQYSAAVSVFEYLTGSPPFEVADGIPRKGSRVPHGGELGIEGTLNEVLLRASDPDPDRRYPSAAAFVDALKVVTSETSKPGAPEEDQRTLLGSHGVVAVRYAIVGDEVLHGGIADVQLGQTPDGRPVALKVIRGSGHQPRLLQLSFERELAALRELHHEHIVTLIDSGRTPETDEYFLVLEWLTETLDQRLARSPELRNWPTFLAEVARPLGSALAHAHEHHLVHRDVKPANVMFDADGVVKLVDFGISVFKTQLDRGSETLADFMSRPFSPPDRSSTEAYDRDVFGFGALAIAALSLTPVTDYPDLEPALAGLTLPASVRDLLSRCISFDPRTRPTNGLVLLAALDALPSADEGVRVSRSVPFSLTGARFQDQLRESATETGIESLTRYVERDLGSGVFGRFYEGSLGDRQIRLYGRDWSYRAEIDTVRGRLKVYAGDRESAAQLDWRRETATPISFAFREASLADDRGPGLAAVQALIEYLELADERRQDELYDREDRRLLDQWHATLRSLEQHTAGLADPRHYADGRRSGRFFHCTLEEEPLDDLTEQVRRIKTPPSTPRLSGQITETRGRNVVMWLDSETTAEPPRRGVIEIDTSGQTASLKRQREALNSVRFKSPLLRRQDFPDLLIRPDRSAASVPLTVTTWFESDLSIDKREAVLRALGSGDFFLVQGPPGTGKTTFIAELVAQELKRNPDARILLTSQTHVALDNALERLMEIVPASIRMVRLASSDGRVADSSLHLLLDKQLAAWRRDVKRRSEKALERIADEHGISSDTLEAALAVESLRDLRTSPAQATSAPRSDPDRDGDPIGAIQDQSEEEAAADDVETSGADRREREQRSQRLEGQIATLLRVPRKRIESASPDDLGTLYESLIPDPGGAAGVALCLARLHVEWVERVIGRGPQFDEPLLFGSNVIAATCIGLASVRAARDIDFDLCILDEASKATPTEVLVPFVRGRRWVLVGDDRQLPPYQERAVAELDRIEDEPDDAEPSEQTLFDWLGRTLPESNSVKLTTQHRMVPAIGNLIGHVFYDDELRSVPRDPPLDLGLVFDRPVTWFDTRGIAAHGERQAGTSFLNDVEAREVAAFAERLAGAVRLQKANALELLVLSGYKPQANSIDAILRSRADLLDGVTTQCLTVDKAQGRQAHIVAFSVTRSNPRNVAGFLKDMRRINVALSRARFGLAIFGDLGFCERAPGALREVVAHVRANPAECAIVDLSRDR